MEFVHFGLTSEDVNCTANPLALLEFVEGVGIFSGLLGFLSLALFYFFFMFICSNDIPNLLPHR